MVKPPKKHSQPTLTQTHTSLELAFSLIFFRLHFILRKQLPKYLLQA